MVQTLALMVVWGFAGWLAIQGYPELSVIVAGLLYGWHLRTYPNKRCPAKCTGGHVFSGLMRKTSHPCTTCRGSGRVPRRFAALVARKNGR